MCQEVPSSRLPLRQHPRPDLRLEHLADLGAWKVIPDFDLLGRFDAPNPLLHERRYRCDIDGTFWSRLHHGDNPFAPLLIRQTKSGRPLARLDLKNIRLGSAAANPLSRSRNQRADEDG